MTKILFALLASFFLTVSAQASTNLLVTSEFSQNSVQTADYGSHWFGRVLVNTRAIARYTLTNTGNEPLEYVRANIWGMFFDAYHNCTGTLQPGQKCRFDITYWPSFEGNHSGDFIMNFKQDTVQIRVWGEAIRQF